MDIETNRFRTLKGSFAVLEATILSALPISGLLYVLDVPAYVHKAILTEQYLGLFLALILCGTFLTVPASANAPRDRIPWYDLGLAGAGLVSGVYLIIFYSDPAPLVQLGYITWERVPLAILAVLLILEALRRLAGWFLVVLVLLFLLYARFTDLVPGLLGGRGTSWESLLNSLYLSSDFLLGVPLSAGASVVLPFILFGSVLIETGGGLLLTSFATAVFGRFRGGPAKVAILASSLFGTISGSPVANVAVDGAITIPMMKSIGYKPHVAAAIEAVASTGGQIMPPVMGVASFIMAEFLAVPYREVVIAAVIPAMLYYIALFVQVDLEAAKMGMRGLSREEIPPVAPVFKETLSFILPLAVLVYAMFFIPLSAGKAGAVAALTAAAAGFVRKENRAAPLRLLRALPATGRAMLDLGVLLAAAGIIIGVAAVTGLGFKLSAVLLEIGKDSAFLLLFFTAIVSMILGMGLPTSAVYILLAILVAPALTQYGILPMAAHFFIFYFGVIAVITPPIAFASFTAASIGGASPMQTGWAGTRLAALAYIVPFLFVYSPALLMRGPVWEIAASLATAIAGTWVLGMALVGYWQRPLPVLLRLMLGLSAIGLLIPLRGDALASWVPNLLGVGVAVPLLVRERWRASVRKYVPVPTAVE
ncbi:MAG: TRAP transporter fused permease subunit [Deltaproteobacteria bacterium]|nr:TRAP transporter fused permease subunit [Deltaproteobacteria bacterium]